MARTKHTTNYYDYIDTCYTCKKCGAKKYVKGVETLVGWKSETTSGYGSDGRYHSAERDSREKKIYISDDGYHHIFWDNSRGWCEKCLAERIINERKERRRSLKHDPVEMRDEYLAVIDAVEERVEAGRTLHGHGSCFEVWALKKSCLLEHGIFWRTPAELNPRVHVD